MPKVECPNCKAKVPVIPPEYRCKECNYPLNKAKEQEVHIRLEGGGAQQSGGGFDGATLVDNPGASGKRVDINIGQQPKEPPRNAGGQQYSGATHLAGNQKKADSTPVKKVQNNNPEKRGKVVAGWLIVHTENREKATYDLFEGDNFFGTRAEGYAVDIPIEGDKYVSRSHANIRIAKDFLHRFHYELIDDGARRPQGPSLNGTYINGNKERLPRAGRIFLRDGDTIQIGETKLVFKNVQEVHDVEEAVTAVMNTGYTATVILPQQP